MKILLVTSPSITGISYHRQLVPHKHLANNYPDIELEKCYHLNEVSDETLRGFNIVSFLRCVDTEGNSANIVKRAKDCGCITVMDIDDYWNLHKDHELNANYAKTNYQQQVIDSLKAVDYVTTTTEHFADKIKEYNDNVMVIPNSIDATEAQFVPQYTQSDRTRIGWVGGVFHIPDVKMVYSGFKEVWKDVKHDKFQLCLGGYNEPNQQYEFMEFIFTDQGKYKTEGIDKPYRRLWGKDVQEYASLYNDIDVALVPLIENNFNSYKSQIKIIEAGWFKKAVVVSNVMPYTIDCNNRNAILIHPNKRNEGWGVAMKSLILNPNKREDLAEALHETVKDKYNMDNVNKLRFALYKHITE